MTGSRTRGDGGPAEASADPVDPGPGPAGGRAGPGGPVRALPRWVVAVTGLSVAALWAPVLWRLSESTREQYRVLGINDFQLHVEIASRFEPLPHRIEAPHLLFHAVTWVFGWFVATPVAAVLTLVAATVLTFVAVVRLLAEPLQDGRGLSDRVALGLGVAYFLAETPTLLLLWTGAVDPSTPFQTVHWWGNPTWLAGLPFAFLALPRLVRVAALDGSDPPSRRDVRTLAGLIVLGALAKPSFALVLIPALPTFLLLTRASRRAVRDLVIAVVLPAVAVVVWQTWFVRSGASASFSASFVFDPIVQPAFGWARAGPVYWIPSYVVLLALVLGGRSFLRDRMVQLVLVCLAFAVPLMLSVTEGGERAGHGNLAVPTQVCAALLFVLAVRSCAIRFRSAIASSTGRSRAVIVTCVLVGFLFVAGGVLSYLDALSVLDVPTDWFAFI